MSYLQVLIALTSYAVSHPKEFAALWQDIVDLWLAGQKLAATAVLHFNEAVAMLPVPREVELIESEVLTGEVLDAETKFEAAIAALPQPRASTRGIFNSGSGNFRKIIGQLMGSPLGQALLQQLLGKITG